jgi:type I restriction enzyme S subunit
MWTEFVSDTEMKVTPKGIKESSTNLIPIGSLLIVGRSGILKRKLPVAINIVECTVNQDMKVIVPLIISMNRFLQFMFWGLESIILREFVKFGMTVHSLKYDEFSQMPIPLPPLPIQNKIVEKLNELMQHCNALEESIKASQTYNQQLMQQILKEALEVKEEEII